MKAYRYVFYKFYRFMHYLGNDGFYPEIKAYFLFSLCIWANILSIIAVVEISLNRRIFNYPVLVVFAILCLVVNYYFTIRKDRYEDFLKEFENEKPAKAIFGSILALVYLVGSNLLFVYSANIVRNNLIFNH